MRVFITIMRPAGVSLSHCVRVFVQAALFPLKLISQILLKSTSFKHKLGRRCGLLSSLQVTLNSVYCLHRRGRK